MAKKNQIHLCTMRFPTRTNHKITPSLYREPCLTQRSNKGKTVYKIYSVFDPTPIVHPYNCIANGTNLANDHLSMLYIVAQSIKSFHFMKKAKIFFTKLA